MTTAPDALSSTLQMLTALAVVLGGLFIVFYFLKRFMKRNVGGQGTPLIRVIANQYIGVKKNIALIEVPGTVLVVGISNDRINLLTQIEDQDVLERIKEESSHMTPSFADQLQRLTTRFKQTKNRS